MTFSTIIALIFAHWHKAVAVVALFAALYNKFSKSKGLDALVKRIDQIENFEQPTVKKARTPKKSRSKGVKRI